MASVIDWSRSATDCTIAQVVFQRAHVELAVLRASGALDALLGGIRCAGWDTRFVDALPVAFGFFG
jgi:hypothetical protein